MSESPLEPGACGVVRTITLPLTPGYPVAPVSRQGTSIALGPWKTGELSAFVHAVVIDERGQSQSFEASGSRNDNSWSLLLAQPRLALEVFVRGIGGGADDAFDSRVWENGEVAPQDRGNVVNAVWRGTDVIQLAPALDGQRGVFAIWPHGLSGPRAAVIGPDGARVGDAHAFSAPDKIMRCPAVTPTAHGAFVSFVDSQDELRSFELGPEGELVREAAWPLPTEGIGCPSFTLADGGLAFLLDRALYEQPSDIGLYRLDAEGAVTEIALPAPTDAREVAMLGDDPLLLRWSSVGAELVRPRRNELWPITLPAGLPRRIPSEPGSIWLDLDSPEEGRKLVQLSCG